MVHECRIGASQFKTLLRRKRIFREMGCSHFHMSREYPRRYEEYRALRISADTEAAWRQAAFDSQLDELMHGDGPASDLWARHARLADLAGAIRQRDCLRRFFVATQQMVSLIPSASRILVAETLVGRHRNGHDVDSMIRLAHALGDVELARDIANLVPLFCDASDAPIGGPSIRERKGAVLARLQAQRTHLNL
jgi:hypothetical protein